jgi:AcrR family transcriptional regulator
VSTRDRILDGAAQVMRERGVANSTTKQIARAAGFSEATLYKVFEDKIDIFLAVLNERLGRQPGRPSFTLVQEGPTARVGRSTVQRNLETIATDALLFYVEVFPMGASLFSDPELLARYRVALANRGTGPHTVVEAVAEYLRAEQREGRITAGADSEAAAMLLVGGCYHRAFLLTFAGQTITRAMARRFATALVRTLLPALQADSAAPKEGVAAPGEAVAAPRERVAARR